MNIIDVSGPAKIRIYKQSSRHRWLRQLLILLGALVVLTGMERLLI